jgi:hypothetical protein
VSVHLDREASNAPDRGTGQHRPQGLIGRLMSRIRAVARFAYDLLKDLF